MLKINFVIIFFLILIAKIDGIDDDLFDDLWKNVKPSTSKNFKKQKNGENNAIKEEFGNENYKQQNANKVEMEDTKPKQLLKIKKEPTDEKKDYLQKKIKEPKIEMDQLSKESFQNVFNEQVDQNVLSADQNNSADDVCYNKMNTEIRKEIEFLNKFDLMKKEFRNESFYKKMTKDKFESEIAKKLGTNRDTIYKLWKKLGQKRERTEESEETKMELIRKFDKMRKEKIYGFKYDKKKRNKIESEIANELGTNRYKIYKWKREFDLLTGFSNQQKLEKIQQFERVREEFTKKFNFKPNWKIESKIAEKIGVARRTIYAWTSKFGLITRKTKLYTDAEKLEYVKRSEEMTERNPMTSERKIAEKLGISNANLRRWKEKFGKKSNH